jgi:hypothetical protein
MRLTKEDLSIKVVVRRVRRGKTPFVWQINRENAAEPVYISPDGFRSMEDAYRAGQQRLPEFAPSSRLMPVVTNNRLRRTRRPGAKILDQTAA